MKMQNNVTVFFFGGESAKSFKTKEIFVSRQHQNIIQIINIEEARL